jgi:hypothetical protein
MTPDEVVESLRSQPTNHRTDRRGEMKCEYQEAYKLALKTIDKIWDRVNGSDADEKMYWAVLKIIENFRKKG